MKIIFNEKNILFNIMLIIIFHSLYTYEIYCITLKSNKFNNVIDSNNINSEVETYVDIFYASFNANKLNTLIINSLFTRNFNSIKLQNSYRPEFRQPNEIDEVTVKYTDIIFGTNQAFFFSTDFFSNTENKKLFDNETLKTIWFDEDSAGISGIDGTDYESTPFKFNSITIDQQSKLLAKINYAQANLKSISKTNFYDFNLEKSLLFVSSFAKKPNEMNFENDELSIDDDEFTIHIVGFKQTSNFYQGSKFKYNFNENTNFSNKDLKMETFVKLKNDVEKSYYDCIISENYDLLSLKFLKVSENKIHKFYFQSKINLNNFQVPLDSTISNESNSNNLVILVDNGVIVQSKNNVELENIDDNDKKTIHNDEKYELSHLLKTVETNNHFESITNIENHITNSFSYNSVISCIPETYEPFSKKETLIKGVSISGNLDAPSDTNKDLKCIKWSTSILNSSTFSDSTDSNISIEISSTKPYIFCIEDSNEKIRNIYLILFKHKFAKKCILSKFTTLKQTINSDADSKSNFILNKALTLNQLAKLNMEKYVAEIALNNNILQILKNKLIEEILKDDKLATVKDDILNMTNISDFTIILSKLSDISNNLSSSDKINEVNILVSAIIKDFNSLNNFSISLNDNINRFLESFAKIYKSKTNLNQGTSTYLVDIDKSHIEKALQRTEDEKVKKSIDNMFLRKSGKIKLKRDNNLVKTDKVTASLNTNNVSENCLGEINAKDKVIIDKVSQLSFDCNSNNYIPFDLDLPSNQISRLAVLFLSKINSPFEFNSNNQKLSISITQLSKNLYDFVVEYENFVKLAIYNNIEFDFSVIELLVKRNFPKIKLIILKEKRQKKIITLLNTIKAKTCSEINNNSENKKIDSRIDTLNVNNKYCNNEKLISTLVKVCVDNGFFENENNFKNNKNDNSITPNNNNHKDFSDNEEKDKTNNNNTNSSNSLTSKVNSDNNFDSIPPGLPRDGKDPYINFNILVKEELNNNNQNYSINKVIKLETIFQPENYSNNIDNTKNNNNGNGIANYTETNNVKEFFNKYNSADSLSFDLRIIEELGLNKKCNI
jgi:hypothetical protein